MATLTALFPVEQYIVCCVCFQRKQKDVQKENEFYIHLLQQALPIEQQNVERQKGGLCEHCYLTPPPLPLTHAPLLGIVSEQNLNNESTVSELGNLVQTVITA